MTIELKDIGKRYDTPWIFRNINANFASGKIHGITGTNGSGKSTLLQIISGYVTPTQGSVIYNPAISPDDVHQQVSICAPFVHLFEEMTVEEATMLHVKLKNLPKTEVAHILQRTELDIHSRKLLKSLSSGMKQRLALALTAVAPGSVLLLDEPTAFLDQNWIRWYNDLLAEYAAGKTVIIATNAPDQDLIHANGHVLQLSSD
ncbi:MAG: lantibiotic protection ABC transporter ATP-binding protein [Salibacteraceae bacterium]